MKNPSLITIVVLATLLFGFEEAFPGGSQLLLVKPSENQVEIQMTNDDHVAALQFTIIATGGIDLQLISLSGRTDYNTWTLSFFKTSDSVMNIVMLRKSRNCLGAGSGTIALVQFAMSAKSSTYSISLGNVIVSTPGATRVDVELHSIEWITPAPKSFTLDQNYPNPFNPNTSIPFTLSQSSSVTVTVYDIAGRQIKRIADGMLGPGSHTVTWNGADERGTAVPSGIYLVALRVGDLSQVRKVVLAR